MKVNKVISIHYYTTRVVIFWLMAAMLLVSGFVYIYLVNAAIVNIVDRKQAQSDLRTVAANISELESEYFELSSSITPEYAQELGFTESHRTLFAVRGSYSGLAQLGE